jgi:hypothetical protein
VHHALNMLASLLVEDMDGVFAGIPELPALQCRRLFQRLNRPILPASAPKCTTKASVEESVQAFMSRFLADLLDSLGGQYKVMSEKVLAPSTAKPDHVVVLERDVFADLSNSIIIIEDKPREDEVAASLDTDTVKRGALEAIGYIISRVEHQHDRFEHASMWTAFAVFTNGLSVRIFCVSLDASGGTGTESSILATPLLPLFHAVAPSDAARDAAPPAGFAALARLLAASPAQLGDLAMAPSSLALRLNGALLQLDERLGTGGFTDVYACRLEGEEVVVKCAQLGARTRVEHAGLHGEAATLRALNAAGCPSVPCLVAAGEPPPPLPRARFPPLAVPFLVLSPRGEPLCAHACTLDTAEERLALARRVVRDVLRALRGAHAAGYIHGDVRPSNVVLNARTDGALLVDWGAALPLNEKSTRTVRLGTLAFACDAVALCFEPTSTSMRQRDTKPVVPYAAVPAVDLEPVAYLFAAVALGGERACAPLWHDQLRAPSEGGTKPRRSPPAPLLSSAADAVAARAKWLEAHLGALGEGVFAFLERVRAGEMPYDADFF